MPLNDFDNYADLHDGVTGDTIRAAAEDPNENTNVIAALANELAEDDQHVAADIEGDIEAGARANPQSARGTALNLARAGRFAVALLNEFAGHVDTFDTGVDDLNRRLRSDVASAQRYAAQSAVHSDEEPPEYAETWSSIRAYLLPEYVALDDTLENHAESIASRFEQGPTEENVKELILAGLIPYTSATGLWPTLTFTADERRQALRNEVANMSASEQAQWVRDNADVGPEIVEVISDEAQALLAEDVAADIHEPETIDAETVRLLDLFQEEPAFAHALYSDVTPEQMGDAIEHLNSQAYPRHAVDVHGAEEERELYRDFLTAAGATLATYTKGTGEHAPPANLVDTWYDAITRTESYDHETGKPVNSDAAALTLLIRAGGQESEYDARFISDLTDRVYEWEREQDGPVWAPRNDQPAIYDPFRDPQPMYEGHGGVAGYSSPASDGLANLMGAMASSPEGSRLFFDDGQGGVDSSKLDYLIGEKDGKEVDARTFSASRDSDEGEGLGQALEAAGVRDGDDPSSHAWSAAFTTDVFERVADLSGHGNQTGPDDRWHVWPEMADNLGHMAAGYADDVYDIANPDGPSPSNLLISTDELNTVLGEIGRGRDKSGIETLSAAVMIEGNRRLDATIHGADPDAFSDAVAGTADTNGEVLGHIINHAITVDQDDMELAEARAAMVSKALDIAGGFIPGAGSVLGEGASQLAQSAYSTATSEGLSALKDAVEGTPDAIGPEWKSDQRNITDEALRYHTTNQLYLSGAVDVPDSITIEGPAGNRVINPALYGGDDPEDVGATDEFTAEQILAGWNEWSTAPDGGLAPVQSTQTFVDAAQNGLDRTLNKEPDDDE